MKYLIPAMIAVGLSFAANSAHAEPINVCINNNGSATMWLSLRFPGGGISNFTLLPHTGNRQQGDSAGIAPSSP